MINTWEIALNGYKAPIASEFAGGIKEAASAEVGKSKKYTKRKTEFWAKGGPRPNCRQVVVKAFVEEKLSAKEIVEKYGFTYNYVRIVLVEFGLVEEGIRHGKKAVVIIYESGKVVEYDSVGTAQCIFGLKTSAFRRHLQKKGNVNFKHGMKAMFKQDYEELKGGK